MTQNCKCKCDTDHPSYTECLREHIWRCTNCQTTGKLNEKYEIVVKKKRLKKIRLFVIHYCCSTCGDPVFTHQYAVSNKGCYCVFDKHVYDTMPEEVVNHYMKRDNND